MITDSTLKARMDGFEESQRETLAILKRLEFSIKGDLELGHPGIVRTQALQQIQIDEIIKAIEKIHKKNEDQDLSIGVKKQANGTWISWGKTAIRIAIELIIIYGILKGVVSIDALHK